MASTTSSSTQNTSTVRQRRPIQPGYVLPGSYEKPKCLISSRHGPAMRPSPMKGLCVELMKLDQLLVEWCILMENAILDLSYASQEIKVRAQHDIHDLTEIESQLSEVSRGDFRLHEKYPEDRCLIQYWWGCITMLTDLNYRPGNFGYVANLQNIKLVELTERQILVVETQLINTAGHFELPPNVRSAFKVKWDTLRDRSVREVIYTSTFAWCQSWYVLPYQYAIFTADHHALGNRYRKIGHRCRNRSKRLNAISR